MEKKPKKILIEKRNELTDALPDRESIAVERLPDMIDDVRSSNQRELTLASINRHWNTVRAIDAALNRIENGAYGVCGECGEAIQPKRLEVLPWAILCRHCQERKDAAEAEMRHGDYAAA